MLENGSEEDILGVGMNQVLLQRGNKLPLLDAPFAPRVRICLLPLVFLMRSGFTFSSCQDDLNILMALCLALLV